ncbi:MAG: glycosyltransferase family 2 protein [Candidatus Manganitrophaceae bacterium]
MTNAAASAQGPLISVCVPTFKRARLLPRLFAALEKQKCPEGTRFEILVVDNDPARSAESVVFEEARKIRIPVRYVSEPVQGFASVRNRIIDEAGGRWIAWIDDDEWPSDLWLNALVNAWRATGADVVFGPVVRTYPKRLPEWMIKSNILEGPRLLDGLVSPAEIGSGNFFCEKRLFEKYNVRFSQDFNAGGEDSDLFARIYRAGARFIACKDAVVFEELSEDRTRVTWWLRRAFRGGYNHARIHGLGNQRASIHYFAGALIKVIILSALSIPAALLGCVGVVKVGIPLMANLGKIAAYGRDWHGQDSGFRRAAL